MADVPNDLEYWACTEVGPDGLPIGTRRPCSLPLLTPRGSIQPTVVDRIEGWLYRHSALYQVMTAQVWKAQAIWAIRMERNADAANRAAQLEWVAPTALAADWVSLERTPEIENNVKRSMELLGATIMLLNSKNIPVLLASVPHYLQYTGVWSTRPHAVLEETVRWYGAAYLNSYEARKPAISGTDVDEYYWLTDNTHFSENGNEIWADAEVRFLLDRELLVEGN